VEGVRRGDLVTIAVGGDYGKPRPALVVRADVFLALPSVTVLRLTSDIGAEHLVRVTVTPTAENGLAFVSQVMVDKAVSVPREKVGAAFGRLDESTMQAVGTALAGFLGLNGAI
jgi:mRNA interferase MazF